jgi:hypothetical protein
LSLSEELSHKLDESIQFLQCVPTLTDTAGTTFNSLLSFKEYLDKHIDLVRRRLIYNEKIPHEEKMFSLFEPHTEWIKKGKTRPQVELGLRIAVATDQDGFILDYLIMQDQQDVDIAVPFGKRLLDRYSINSLSFDKGFWNPDNFKELNDSVNHLVMPKKGRLSKTDKEREQEKTFRALRHKHSAVESAINCLEHHGLNQCPDKGIVGFKRYTAIGVLAYNLHKLGNILLDQDRTKYLTKKKAA